MRISIAMATFNGAEYILEQLESILNQQRQPDELVVCDDGSTDSTLELLESFSQVAPFPVHVYRNETNVGYTKNFEKAFLHCSGDVIFLSDQDDKWLPSKVGVVEEAFLANPDKLLIIHDGEIVDEGLVSHGATKLSQVMSGYGTDDHFVTGGLTAISRNLQPYILPVPEGIVGHDGWFHNVARLLDTRLVLDQSLQLIRRHNSNTSSWVASSVERIGKMDVVKSQYQTAPAKEYEDRLLINDASQIRLRMALNGNSLFSQGCIEKGLDYLRSEHAALCSRNNLPKLDGPKRKIAALQLLVRGEYRFFNGYRSFLRDILR